MTYKLIRLFFIIILFNVTAFAQTKEQVIIDADTANEIDDLYAITRGLLEPTWNVTTLNATQWQVSQWATERTMEDSYRLNLAILKCMQLRDKVKLCRGAAARMFDWGNLAQHSEAAYEIIKQANLQPKGKKLMVVVLGALTNVASALLIEPAISEKMKVYWLGTSYDFEKRKAKLIDFNAVMDIQAVDVMLSSTVEMHIIPNNIAQKNKYRFAETVQNIIGVHPITELLIKRWEDVDASKSEHVMWDLALIQAIIYPEKVKEMKANWFDNPNVSVYSDFDIEFFKKDFFKTIGKMKK